MKRTLHVVTALTFVAGAALTSTPAALAQEQRFVLFSNKSDVVMNACYTSRDGNGTELAHDCDAVRIGGKSTYWIPLATSKTRVTVSDGLIQLWARDHTNSYNLCLRASRSASVHEATEQPCTPD
ncbi:hypothetical protein JNUCC0626_47935 [Lentzea sp. JNUCC 0626]|uniref:hypothetical protein n=1 Tax=Lentzea sp. JNUCC 0626 TaxID=3367513 RepID=UPI003749AE64